LFCNLETGATEVHARSSHETDGDIVFLNHNPRFLKKTYVKLDFIKIMILGEETKSTVVTFLKKMV
jgi:hypothetical protein